MKSIFDMSKYEIENLVKNEAAHVYEVLVDAYDFGSDDYDMDDVHDHVWEIIDGLEVVIYTNRARKIAEAYYYCPFNSVSDMTGEKFNSWEAMAFEIIYNKFYELYEEQINY